MRRQQFSSTTLAVKVRTHLVQEDLQVVPFDRIALIDLVQNSIDASIQ